MPSTWSEPGSSLHVEALGSKFKLLHLVSSLSEVGGEEADPGPPVWVENSEVLCAWSMVSKWMLPLAPRLLALGFLQCRAQGRAKCSLVTSADKVLSCRFLTTLQ